MKRKSQNTIETFNRKKRKKAEVESLNENDVIEISPENIDTFTDIPLSANTQKGLKECGYIKPTKIQKDTLLLSLNGKDILGAAKTGSGKTLAFLVPILELLNKKKWTSLDGVGALIITPTRELAYQIFEMLKKLGRFHNFSAGLIIGGKDLKFERNRVHQCNIIICTPGRLLQHMDENPLFDCVNMQILVLDEADRCLDMGFEASMNAIIANLPIKRQTLLFSATQTKSVKDLARLSLKDPLYVSVHKDSKYTTPTSLEQSYTVCELENKVMMLWSFLKRHLKQKIIMFFSTCKQVKYMFEIFSKLRPGISLMALYGTLHQLRRMEIYESFSKKSNAVLFCTDIAARGLDFPEVNWVVQGDCPEDSDTYIHRVGRTARYHKDGKSWLLLLPSETAILEDLEKRKIPISNLDINENQINNPIRKIEAYLASNVTLKDSAQRAFVSYVKSVFLMKDKRIFNVQKLNTDKFAHSLGLVIPPRIRFLQKKLKMISQRELPNNNNKKIDFEENEYTKNDDKVDSSDSNDNETIQKRDKPVFDNFGDDSDENDDVFTVKRRNVELDLPPVTELEAEYLNRGRNKKKPLTKAALAKQILRKNIVTNKKIIFNDDCDPIVEGTSNKQSELAQEYENENVGGIDISQAKLILKEEDTFDKQRFKEKVKRKHKEMKKKLKEAKKAEEDAERDEFGEEESDNEPDLSWLPSLDKMYGDKTEEVQSENEDLDAPQIQKKPKSAKKSKTSEVSKSKKNKSKTSSLGIKETEELAMMLLNKNS